LKQDLFDFGTDPAPVEAGHGEAGMVDPATPPAEGESTSVAASAGSVVEWREVPQALFLSWSAARQFAYCAARDEDAATREPNAEWYRQRAQSYRELSHEDM
jgi:hypothetical protein